MSKTEIKIIAVILIICALLGVIIFFMSDRGDTAVIYLNDKVIARRSLSVYGRFTLPEARGMIFEIDENGIRVAESDCPDKICVKTGYVSSDTGSAVCMPNRVIVTVEECHE